MEKKYMVITAAGDRKIITSKKTLEELLEYIKKYDVYVCGKNVFQCEDIKEIFEKNKK